MRYCGSRLTSFTFFLLYKIVFAVILYFAKLDSDRFITSFLIQKCDSFTSLYVFLITSHLPSFYPFLLSLPLCKCASCLPAALCCLCFDFQARNQRKAKQIFSLNVHRTSLQLESGKRI